MLWIPLANPIASISLFRFYSLILSHNQHQRARAAAILCQELALPFSRCIKNKECQLPPHLLSGVIPCENLLYFSFHFQAVRGKMASAQLIEQAPASVTASAWAH